MNTRGQIPAAFAALKQKRADAVVVLEGALALANRDVIIAQAASTRIPALHVPGVSGGRRTDVVFGEHHRAIRPRRRSRRQAVPRLEAVGNTGRAAD